MDFVLKHRGNIIGVAFGAVAGFLYYYFVGCASGTCAITSSPINSSLYGAMMGYLLSNTFEKEKIKDSNQ